MNQRFGRRRSRFDNTFKGKGEPVVSKSFQESVIYLIIYGTYLRQYSGGELRFELDGISLVVNWRFDVIYRENTGND